MKRILPLLVLILAIGYLASSLFSRRQATEFDLEGFGRLPVLVNGRLKPLDTVGRTSLLMLQGRQRVSSPLEPRPFVTSPTEWLVDVLACVKASTLTWFPGALSAPTFFVVGGAALTGRQRYANARQSAPAGRNLELAGGIRQENATLDVRVAAPAVPDDGPGSPSQAL